MSEVPSDLRPLIAGIAQQKGLPPTAEADIAAAIASSPYLIATMGAAKNAGRLERVLVSDDPNEAGHYDGKNKTVSIAANHWQQDFNTQSRVDYITATLGHEVTHAYFHDYLKQSLSRLDYQVQEALRDAGPGGRADLTQPFEQYLNAMRENEALAEIGGMNAVASRVSKDHGGKFDLKDFLKRADASTQCINLPPKGDIPIFTRPISISEDGRIHAGSISPVPDTAHPNPNREAVAQCHFDLPASIAGLGQHGDSDYRNLYARRAIQSVALLTEAWVDPPEIALDLQRLKLSARQIERNGLDLDSNWKAFGFIDVSHGASRLVSIRNTASGEREKQPDALDAAPATQAQRAEPVSVLRNPYLRMLSLAAQAGDENAFREAEQLLLDSPYAKELERKMDAQLEAFAEEQARQQQMLAGEAAAVVPEISTRHGPRVLFLPQFVSPDMRGNMPGPGSEGGGGGGGGGG